MRHILTQSFKDFLHPKILALVCLPFILNVLLLGSFIYAYGSMLYEYLFTLMPHFVQDIATNDALWAKILYSLSLISFYIAMFLLILLFALLSNLFCAIFYTPFIVHFVHKKDFAHITLQPFGTLWGDSLAFFKDALIFVALFVLCVPLFFIPLIGGFVPFILGLVFFKKRTFYDVSSCIMSKADFKALQKATLSNYTYALTAYIPSLIPFVSFFVMPLQLLLITRYVFHHIAKIP